MSKIWGYRKWAAAVLVPIVFVAFFALYRAAIEGLDFFSAFDAAVDDIANAVWVVIQHPVSLTAIALFLLLNFGRDQLMTLLSLFTEIGGAGFRGKVHPRLYEQLFGRTEQDDGDLEQIHEDEPEPEPEPELGPVPDVPVPVGQPDLLEGIIDKLDPRLLGVLLEIAGRRPSWEELYAIAVRVLKLKSQVIKQSHVAWYFIGAFHSLVGSVLVPIDPGDVDVASPLFFVNPDAIELLEARKAAFDKRKEKYAAT